MPGLGFDAPSEVRGSGDFVAGMLGVVAVSVTERPLATDHVLRRSPEGVAPAAKNNDSLVVRLRYGTRSLLLPGDAEKEVEHAMIAENDAGRCNSGV